MKRVPAVWVQQQGSGIGLWCGSKKVPWSIAEKRGMKVELEQPLQQQVCPSNSLSACACGSKAALITAVLGHLP